MGHSLVERRKSWKLENKSWGSHQPTVSGGSLVEELESQEEEPHDPFMGAWTLIAEAEKKGKEPKAHYPPPGEGSFEQDGKTPTETVVGEGDHGAYSAIQVSELVNPVAVISQNCVDEWPTRFADGKTEIRFDSADVGSFSNQIKGMIEDYFGAPVDWWPLSARERPLPNGFTRVRWTCVSRDPQTGGISR